MIRLAVVLCEKRHTVRAKAYEHREGASLVRIEQQLIAEVPHRCPRCGRGGFKLEHSDTAFQSLAEAIPHVAKLNGVKRAES